MATDFLTMINSAPTGWVKEMGLHFVEATPDRVVATGRVRLHSFEPGEAIAGQAPRMERG